MSPAVCPIPDRLALLDSMTLDHGSHSSFEEGHCANEVYAWLAGEPHTDDPKCVCKSIRSVTMRFNDRVSDKARRTRVLLPLAPFVIGTRGSEALRRHRMWMAADWSMRVATPAILRVAGMESFAKEMETMPEIVDRASADAAYQVAYRAREAAWARRRKVYDAIYGKARAEAAAEAAEAAAVAAAVAAAAAAAVAAAEAAAAAAVAAAIFTPEVHAAARAASEKSQTAGQGWSRQFDAAKAIYVKALADAPPNEALTRLRAERDRLDVEFVALVKRMAAVTEADVAV